MIGCTRDVLPRWVWGRDRIKTDGVEGASETDTHAPARHTHTHTHTHVTQRERRPTAPGRPAGQPASSLSADPEQVEGACAAGSRCPHAVDILHLLAAAAALASLLRPLQHSLGLRALRLMVVAPLLLLVVVVSIRRVGGGAGIVEAGGGCERSSATYLPQANIAIEVTLLV